VAEGFSRGRLITALYVTAQIAIPFVAWAAGSSYFGWRMFSEVRVPPRVVVTRAASTDTASAQDYLGFPRGDISYGDDLATQICRLIPDAIAVRVWPSTGVLRPAARAMEVRCR